MVEGDGEEHVRKSRICCMKCRRYVLQYRLCTPVQRGPSVSVGVKTAINYDVVVYVGNELGDS